MEKRLARKEKKNPTGCTPPKRERKEIKEKAGDRKKKEKCGIA